MGGGRRPVLGARRRLPDQDAVRDAQDLRPVAEGWRREAPRRRTEAEPSGCLVPCAAEHVDSHAVQSLPRRRTIHAGSSRPSQRHPASSRPAMSRTRQTRAVRRAVTSLSAGERTAQILARVRAIPPGFVRTYGDVDPKAPRLVGRVLATTDERVPWHRVVRSDGTAPMGDMQLARLRREGVPLRDGRVDLARARVPG